MTRGFAKFSLWTWELQLSKFWWVEESDDARDVCVGLTGGFIDDFVHKTRRVIQQVTKLPPSPKIYGCFAEERPYLQDSVATMHQELPPRHPVRGGAAGRYSVDLWLVSMI